MNDQSSRHDNRPTFRTESDTVVIRSAANATVRHLARMRENRPRRRAGELLTDGVRQTAMAIAAGLQPIGVFVREGSRDQVLAWVDDAVAQSVAQSGTRSIPPPSPQASGRPGPDGSLESLVREVSPAVMSKITYGQTETDLVGQFQWHARSLDALVLPSDPVVLVLDRIEKPGNVGAIFRSANAAGVDAVLLCGGGDVTHANAIRNSQGAVFWTPSVTCDWHAAHRWLADQGIRALAARVESSDPVYQADLSGPIALIVGNEADGLADRWPVSAGVAGVHIPMVGTVDSLNVGVSASLLVYEVLRRRQ